MGLAIILAIFLIPAFFLGMLLLQLFPHIPFAVHFLLVLGLLGGLGLRYFQKSVRAYRATAQPGLPRPASTRKRYLIMFLFATGLGAGASFLTNKKDLYIDNGTGRDIVFEVNGDRVAVPAGHYHKVQIVKGRNSLRYEQATRTLEADDKGDYLFNVDTQYRYRITPVLYGRADILYRGGKHLAAADVAGDARPLPKQEFFRVPADYVFTAPDHIKTERKLGGSNDVRKTLLEHFTKLDSLMMADEQEPAWSEDESATVDTIRVRTRRK